MLSATFIFTQHTNNQDFKVLDDEIMARAQANPGFKGKEKWLSPDGKQIRVIYYFETKESLAEFSKDEVHREAKSRYAEWYDGYRVEIAEITGTWGDGNMPPIWKH
jgi:heme-degrading monooxygenase HmoA